MRTYARRSDGIVRVVWYLAVRSRKGRGRKVRRRPSIWRCRRLSGWHSWWSSTKQLPLSLKAALLGFQGGVSGSNQCVLDRPDVLRREDWSCGYRARNRLFPRLEHLVHLPPGRVVDFGICVHEDGVELGAEIESVWCGNVLYD